MGARQSNLESRAIITSSDALQSNADPLSPAFKASPEMCRLIIAGGPPTAIQKRALGWLLYNWRERGADPATSRLLNFPGLEARPPPRERGRRGLRSGRGTTLREASAVEVIIHLL